MKDSYIIDKVVDLSSALNNNDVKNSLILQGTFLILSSYHNSCIKLKLEKVKVRNLIIFLTVPLEPKRVCISGKAGLQ